MAGLLGSMIAGGIKSVANGRVADIEEKQKFDYQTALMNAQVEKELMLKKAGYEMEDARAQSATNKRKDYMTGSDGAQLSIKEAAAKAMQAGDFESGEGLLKMSPKTEKTFDSIKLDNGSVMRFDKSTGEGSIVFEGVGKVNIPKDETEIIWRAANGDIEAQKAAKMLVEQKSRIAAAGRAPSKPDRLTMDEKEYESYRSDEKSQGKIPKSLYQFNNEKHQIRRESNAETATDEFDEEGNLIGRKVTRKASNAPTAKPKAVAVRTYDPKTKTFK